MKKHNVSHATMLKLTTHILKGIPNKKFRVKASDGSTQIVTTADVIAFIQELPKESRVCNTCGNFNASGKGDRGWCSPKTFTSSRGVKDYCSGWTPMSEEQRKIRRAVYEHTKP